MDIAELIKASENPAQGESILQMMDKGVEFIKKLDTIISTLQKWGVSPSIVEKLAIKYGDLDKVPALPESSRGIVPQSAMHKAVFENLNGLSEAELVQLSKDMEAAKVKK